MADNTQVNPGSGGDVIATDDLTTLNGGGVTGVKVQRMKCGYGDDASLRDVSDSFPLPVKLATGQTHTVTGGTLTKGTQASTGFSVQALKDAGRAIVNASTAIGGVATVAAEALLALDVSRDGAATASATTHAITSGKRYRPTAIVVSLINNSAAIVSARVSLRFNPSGACIATSPIIATAALSPGNATDKAAASVTIPIPDGVEFSGLNQFGLSQVANATTGLLWASIIGFEY